MAWRLCSTSEVMVVNKTERIRQEATALWIETFGEPPNADIDGGRLLSILLERLEPKSYAQLTQAARVRNLTFPR